MVTMLVALLPAPLYFWGLGLKLNVIEFFLAFFLAFFSNFKVLTKVSKNLIFDQKLDF